MIFRLFFLTVYFHQLRSGLGTFDCDCGGCTAGSSYFPSYPQTQCDTVSGTWTSDGVSTGICAGISCAYNGILSCPTVCAACGSGVQSNSNCGVTEEDDGLSVNSGKCSTRIFNQCVENLMKNDGDFAYCDMCMCEEYKSYGGSGSCGADEVLYSCFLSNSACKTQLRQSWIIGFSAIAFVVCCLSVTCILLLCRKKESPQVHF